MLMKHLGQKFVRHINGIHRRTGALWEGRFYSSVVDTGAYLFSCYRYIELNPVRARMVCRPGAFRWSSYGTNAHGEASTIVTPHEDYIALAQTEDDRQRIYRRLFDLSLDGASNDEIRELTRSGLAFGSEEFKRRLEQISGRPMSPQRRRGLTPKPPLGV